MAHEITDSNFEEILKENKIVMADLWAEWCGPCRMVSPIIDELSESFQDKAYIGKVNVDLNTDIPEKYKVRSIPTILLFKDGELVDKIVGALPKTALQGKLEAVLG
jgi:thioredoxin 1